MIGVSEVQLFEANRPFSLWILPLKTRQGDEIWNEKDAGLYFVEEFILSKGWLNGNGLLARVTDTAKTCTCRSH